MPNYAQQGFVGYVNVDGSVVRATSCDVKMTQAITKPDVVDGKFDKTVYQLGPREVGGNISYPAVYEDGDTVTKSFWNAVIQRNTQGRLLNRINTMKVKYAQGVAYTYNDCIIDTFEFSVTQSETVNISCGIFGIDRGYPDSGNADDAKDFYDYRNTRAVTWNDAIAKFLLNVGGSTTVIAGDEIRNFTCTVNNNSARYYTLNTRLTAQDIAATKRDITGSITIMGRNAALASAAAGNNTGNEFRCTELSEVDFGYCVGTKGNWNTSNDVTCNENSSAGCNGNFIVKMPGVVFEIEELAITNELLETTVNYHALPGIPFGPSSQLSGYNFID